MSGAIPPLPNTPSWRDAELKKAQRQFYLLYEFSIKSTAVVRLKSGNNSETVRKSASGRICEKLQ
jgi:hypothetical protein